MKFATGVQCGCSLDHCLGFHEQRIILGKVPLQQKGWKTLVHLLRKAVQSSSKDQVEWLHLWPCLVKSWCGASTTTWDCCWSWGTSSPPTAAVPATLEKGKGDTKMSKWMSIYAYIEPFNLWNCIESRPTTYSYLDIGLKNSSFRLPYQRPSSSADCARELFNGSNRSASLVDCTRKKSLWLGGADFLWLTS